jgi:hypothetical protein
LTPPMNDEEIIHRLEQHFHSEVNAGMITYHVITLADFLLLLSRYDRIIVETCHEQRGEHYRTRQSPAEHKKERPRQGYYSGTERKTNGFPRYLPESRPPE